MVLLRPQTEPMTIMKKKRESSEFIYYIYKALGPYCKEDNGKQKRRKNKKRR